MRKLWKSHGYRQSTDHNSVDVILSDEGSNSDGDTMYGVSDDVGQPAILTSSEWIALAMLLKDGVQYLPDAPVRSMHEDNDE